MIEQELVVTKKKMRLGRKAKQQLDDLDQVRTFQEERMRKAKSDRMEVEGEERGVDGEEDEAEIKPGMSEQNEDQLIETLTSLITKKKINSKNSFDVPMIPIDIQKKYKDMDDQKQWRRISKILGIDKSIYQYRNQEVHNDSYKMMTQLHRENPNNLTAPETIVNQESKNGGVNQELEMRRSKDDCGRGTLELRKDAINMNRGKFLGVTGVCIGELKFSQLKANEKNRFSRFFELNGLLELQMEREGPQGAGFNSKKDKEYCSREIGFSKKIEFIEEIGRTKKKINKLSSRVGECQVFEEAQWNWNVTQQDAEVLLRNLPILDNKGMEEERENIDGENYQSSMLNNEIKEIKQHIEKKRSKLDLAKLQSKESLLGVGAFVFREDAERWMSVTDLKFTNMVFEKDREDQEEENVADRIRFDMDEEDTLKVIECIEKEQNLKSRTKYYDFHQAPLTNLVSKDYLSLLSTRPMGFEEETCPEPGMEGGDQNERDGENHPFDSEVEQVRQKQMIRIHHTMSQIQNLIYPIIAQQPDPKSLLSCYQRTLQSSQKFNDLEFNIFFAAICYLASSKGITLKPVNPQYRIPTDYILVFQTQPHP